MRGRRFLCWRVAAMQPWREPKLNVSFSDAGGPRLATGWKGGPLWGPVMSRPGHWWRGSHVCSELIKLSVKVSLTSTLSVLLQSCVTTHLLPCEAVVHYASRWVLTSAQHLLFVCKEQPCKHRKMSEGLNFTVLHLINISGIMCLSQVLQLSA